MSKLPFSIGVLLLLSLNVGRGQDPSTPPPLPANAPKLDRDLIVMTAGSSITMNHPYREEIPAWTGGYDRVPPQTNGQNVFFRVFEMLNDHENMRWRRLTDKDWTRKGTWAPELQLPYNDACYGKRVAYIAADPDDFAELAVPLGYEKIDLIYTTDPRGDAIRVRIDGQAPAEKALVDSFQDTRIPKDAELLPELDTFDSHGQPIKLKRPSQGAKNLIELRSRYRLDPSRSHVFRVERGSRDPGKRILIWGAVYWRGNCVQVVQRAKGGLNCGDLPNYPAIQEVVSMKPDYLLLEAINIRENADQVEKSLSPGFGWCAQRDKSMKTLVYMTSQANSKAFRATYKKKLTDETADACAAAVVKLCKTYKFPLVDVGPAADRWLAANPKAQFIPHIQMDWFHPNQWGAALFGETIADGIRTHWPELPVRTARPLRFP
jgi:hypothetical protein